METYKNDFDKNEDIMLWELHEIRHELYKELNRKTIDDVNADAMKKFQNWQKHKREKCLS